MAKFEKQLFNQKCLFSGMIILHAHAQYIYIVNAKYQKASMIALVQHTQNLKSKQEKKMANYTKLLFCQKNIFWHQTSSNVH